jgi:peptidoglycan hydrolase-like protein with peptidoglycan-binding domain
MAIQNVPSSSVQRAVQIAQVAPGGSPSGVDIIRGELQSIHPKQGGLIAASIGAAEGTLNTDGSKRFTGRSRDVPNGFPYDGHRDPGDGKANVGAFSFNYTRFGLPNPVSPQQADQLQLKNLRDFAPRAAKILSDAGVPTTHPQYKFLAANVMDLQNQLPITIPGRMGFANQLKQVVKEIDAGKDPRVAVAEGRARAFTSSKTGRTFHFTGSYAGALADQRRRVDEMFKTFQANGGGAVSPGGPNKPQGPQGPGDVFGGGRAPSLDQVTAGKAALREGMQGPAVEQIQRELVRTGHLSQEKMNTGAGIFGPATKAAVEAFQQAKGLEADGVVGKDTRAALLEATRPAQQQPGASGTQAPSIEDVASGKARLTEGMRGPAVERLQRELVRTGHLSQEKMNTGVGIFGPATKAAVQAFQQEKGLTPPPGLEGAVGKTTWDTLRNAKAPGAGPVNPGNPANNPVSPALDQVRAGQAVLSPGSQGDGVRALQDQLVRAGFLTRDVANTGRGKFGPNTANAVTLFQVRNGLQPTGQVDQRTLQAIERAPAFNPSGVRTATGFQGGQPFPLTLAPIGTEVEGAGRRTAYLRQDAARAFLDMKRDLERETGRSLGINDSFRSNEDQAARKRQYGDAAATPGFSNHQQGLSLDLDVTNPRVEQWLLKNAHRYGFIRGDSAPDDLVRRLGLSREGHHYTYRPEFADNTAPRYIQR